VFVSVKVPNGGTRGLAKFNGRVGKRASVEFFNAPTAPPRTEEIDPCLVELITLAEQTRLYQERLERHFEHALRPKPGSPPLGQDRGSRVAARLGGAEAFRARQTALTEVLRSHLGARRQFIVFCSDIPAADHLAQGLAEAVGIPVDRQSPEESAWEALGADPARPVLGMGTRSVLHTPLMWLDKAQTWQWRSNWAASRWCSSSGHRPIPVVSGYLIACMSRILAAQPARPANCG
jgi:hypothetical protein